MNNAFDILSYIYIYNQVFYYFLFHFELQFTINHNLQRNIIYSFDVTLSLLLKISNFIYFQYWIYILMYTLLVLFTSNFSTFKIFSINSKIHFFFAKKYINNLFISIIQIKLFQIISNYFQLLKFSILIPKYM